MSTTVIHTIEHDIGIDGVLEIRIGDGDIRLRGVEGTTVRVTGDPGDDLERQLTVDRGSGSLSIRPGRLGAFGETWHPGRIPDLAIDVPRGATLVVESSSGDISGESFTGEQRYRSASGDIRLRDVTGHLTLEAVSGDVDATLTGEAAISVRTVSGDLALRAATIASLRATTTSGDIHIAGRLDGRGPFSIESLSGDALLALAGDVRVDLQTVAGDLRSEIPGRSESRPGRRSMAIGTGGPTLSVRTMSGDVRIVRASPVSGDEPADPDRLADGTRHEAPRDVPGLDARPTVPGPESPPTVVVSQRPAAGGEVPNLADAASDARMAILRALERGEIDVAEAGRRLEAVDSIGEPVADAAMAADDPTQADDTIQTADPIQADDTIQTAEPTTTEEATDA